MHNWNAQKNDNFGKLSEQIKTLCSANIEQKKAIANKLKKLDKISCPSLCNFQASLQTFAEDKISDFSNSKKNNKKEREKKPMKTLRNVLLAAGAGIAAGSAVGYFCAKKNNITETDYVFDDCEECSEVNATTCEKVDYSQTQSKEYSEYIDGYQMSNDGTTIIKKAC